MCFKHMMPCAGVSSIYIIYFHVPLRSSPFSRYLGNTLLNDNCVSFEVEVERKALLFPLAAAAAICVLVYGSK